MERYKKYIVIFDILADTLVFLGIMHFASFLVALYSLIKSPILIVFLQLLMMSAFLAKLYEELKLKEFLKKLIVFLLSLLILFFIVFEQMMYIR